MAGLASGKDELRLVDKGLKCLLEALWNSGIRTVMSCEDQSPTFPGMAWIMFSDQSGALTFLHRYWLEFHNCRDQLLVRATGKKYVMVCVRFPKKRISRLVKIWQNWRR